MSAYNFITRDFKPNLQITDQSLKAKEFVVAKTKRTLSQSKQEKDWD